MKQRGEQAKKNLLPVGICLPHHLPWSSEQPLTFDINICRGECKWECFGGSKFSLPLEEEPRRFLHICPHFSFPEHLSSLFPSATCVCSSIASGICALYYWIFRGEIGVFSNLMSGEPISLDTIMLERKTETNLKTSLALFTRNVAYEINTICWKIMLLDKVFTKSARVNIFSNAHVHAHGWSCLYICWCYPFLTGNDSTQAHKSTPYIAPTFSGTRLVVAGG